MTGAADNPEPTLAELHAKQAELQLAVDKSLHLLASQGTDLRKVADALAEVVTVVREAKPLLESKWLAAWRARRGTPT